MANEWQEFLKKNKGKGYTMKEMSERYCKHQLQIKIKTNIHEGRYVSTKQAIAVAYNQTKNKYPICKKIV